MFSKITSIFNLFRKGQEVANVEAWKAGQITSNILAGVMLAGVQVAKYGIGTSAWQSSDIQLRVVLPVFPRSLQ